MMDKNAYHEKVTSNKTEALFIALTLFFFSLFIWRVNTSRMDLLAIVLCVLCVVFLFYSVNYRTLVIRVSPEVLKLRFGVFTWTVPLDNIAEICLDEMPVVKRLGGAGIHFMFANKRYRVSFNFLEYPRVVIAFKRKAGPVQDISFSTRQPDEVIQLVQNGIQIDGLLQSKPGLSG